MSFAERNAQSFGFEHTQYAGSRKQFRGPMPDLTKDYIAFIGGTETYGKFVKEPFPNLVESELKVTCVNLGSVRSGVDAFLYDPDILKVAGGARMVVLQLPGAEVLSNRFFRVHPRRNDRFVSASHRLRELFPEIDFTDFHFVRHMLKALRDTCPDRMASVEAELSKAWCARIKLLLRTLDVPVLGLVVRGTKPSDLGYDPLFVTQAMIAGVRDGLADLVETSMPSAGRDFEDMVFGDLDVEAAMYVPGPAAHQQTAKMLVPILKDRLRGS